MPGQVCLLLDDLGRLILHQGEKKAQLPSMIVFRKDMDTVDVVGFSAKLGFCLGNERTSAKTWGSSMIQRFFLEQRQLFVA